MSLASNFSLQYQSWIVYNGHKNNGKDHKFNSLLLEGNAKCFLNEDNEPLDHVWYIILKVFLEYAIIDTNRYGGDNWKDWEVSKVKYKISWNFLFALYV